MCIKHIGVLACYFFQGMDIYLCRIILNDVRHSIWHSILRFGCIVYYIPFKTLDLGYSEHIICIYLFFEYLV